MKIELKTTRNGAFTSAFTVLVLILGFAVAAYVLWLLTGIDVTLGYTGKVKNAFDRSTAVSIVEYENRRENEALQKLEEMGFDYRVQAQTLEYKTARDKADAQLIKQAMAKVSTIARDVGLPKPSDAEALTEEQERIVLSVNGKFITGARVYPLLERMAKSLQAKEMRIKANEATADRMREIVELIDAKKADLKYAVERRENKLADLTMAKDVASVNATLAKVEADVAGVTTNTRAGKALALIEDSIDQLNATPDAYNAETAKVDGVSPSDIVDELEDAKVNLDSFWN